MELNPYLGGVIAVASLCSLVCMRQYLLNKAHERRKNAYFPPEELAEKGIEEYTKQKKTVELNQLKSIVHIQKLWTMNIKILETVSKPILDLILGNHRAGQDQSLHRRKGRP